MRIMLTGLNGQVGWELARSLLPLGEVVALTRKQCDLSKPESIPGIVQEIQPNVIVNAAAYTAVDKAEEEETLATTINGTAVGALAEAAKQDNALLIHYSTDYVFDGSHRTPYTEEDTPNPINAYGRSKLVGEQAIQESGCDHLILRTSWVYSARGNNFAKTILKLASQRDELKVVSDQVGAPTNAELIADVTALILNQISLKQAQVSDFSGIYHLTASCETNWYGFAKFLIGLAQEVRVQLKASAEKVYPIPTREFPRPAKRPLYSVLDTDKLRSTFKLTLPEWKLHARRTATEICVEMKGDG